jgi:maltose alpha-D-glucosyltransferase / alpha-amylase
VEYVHEKGEPFTIALLQGYLPNQGDAWGYTLAYLERFLAATPMEKPHGGFVSLMQTLATRTGELHRAFAMRTGDPAFEPEPLTAEDFEGWKEKVQQEANDTLALLERSSNEKARPLLAQRPKLMQFIEACKAPKGAGLKTRHHGDYHLGQVLIANNDFVIIDFEGEPSRPLADARRKHSALRDVAGMLRSFSYAKWSARGKEGGPGGIKDSDGLDAWEAEVRRAFIAAYAAATEGSGLYASFDDVQGMLSLFELEKVLYELRYEINNRPAWVHVPLSGLMGILGGTR